MDVLQSTRSINDACEVQRQLLQQQAPLRFVTAVALRALVDGVPLDGTTKVYAELPIASPYFHGKLTRDRSRVNARVGGLGIATMPPQMSGPLLSTDDVDTLSRMRPRPCEGPCAPCGRIVAGARFEALAPCRALVDEFHVYPSSTRAEQREHWAGCQSKFTAELKN
jgi:hypothetical protein